MSLAQWRHWLWERSPIRPDHMSPGSFLGHLYRPGERVLVFTNFKDKTPAKVVTIPAPGKPVDPLAEFIRGHELGAWFLNQPVSGQWTTLPDGTTSCRAGACVTAWRYLVFESDTLPPEKWLRLIAALPLAVAAIYTSGGKSIHVLVKGDPSKSKEEWDAVIVPYKRTLASLGVDAAALTAVRLTRLPGCWREEKRNLQRLLYLNPEPAETTLLDAPNRESRTAFLARAKTQCPRWNPEGEAFQ